MNQPPGWFFSPPVRLPGRIAFARTMDLVNRRNQAIFGCLDADEQETLSALFDRLILHSRQS